MWAYLQIGIIVGLMLYPAKMGTVYLLKRALPFLKPFFHSTFGLLITDVGMGILGTKTLASMGAGGLTSVVILVTFGFCTFIYVFTILGCKKLHRWKESCI